MPKITFLGERVEAKDIYIKPENFQKRKAKSVERMNSMLHYAETKTKCRSMILLSYFGETDSYRCGICDFCLERNKLDLSNLEFENVTEQVKDLLAKNPLLLSELVDTVKNSSEDKTIKVIQWLIDNEKIVHDSNNKLNWHR
jgi:ATP-dependent DNA helicase RecQ